MRSGRCAAASSGSELYALDGTARQDRPYTVTEHLYSVREEQAVDPDPA